VTPVFTARDGAVVFEGRPLSEYRAITLRQRLVAVALDRYAAEPRAEAFWRLAAELRSALTTSRDQRRIIKTVCSASASPVANRRDPEMRQGHGRESQA
jgi:hypothetical protein